MSKKERARRQEAEGLHEIKNKYRARPVKKREGLVMTAKKKRRILKTCTSISAIVVLILGVFALAMAFFKTAKTNKVPEGFVTVKYEPPTDGSRPDVYSALENIGFMNYRFSEQKNWYSEMHGTTSTPVGPQSVNTFKQYSNNKLIMADVTSSSMVKKGRQFCYVGGEVMWREVVSDSECTKSDSLEAMESINWKSDLKAHMTIPAFMENNGLPGTEFTVYIINEETLDHADEVKEVSGADWAGADYVDSPVFQQTYYLRPCVYGSGDELVFMGADAHYGNQMVFTGGLTGMPVFEYITVTYTFDSSWKVLRAEIEESYTATMGITVKCTSNFTTNYEYNTPKAESKAYDNYFKEHVGKDINNDVKQELDAIGCLTNAFLSERSTFAIGLTVNGKTTNGVISLDASKLDIASIMSGGSVDIGAALGCVGLEAKIGEISFYLNNSTAYIKAGELKARLPLDEFLKLVLPASDQPQTVSKAAEETEEEAPLFAMGEITEEMRGGQKYAHLHADLNLNEDLKIPLEFDFKLDDNQKATLNYLTLDFNYKDTKASVRIQDTNEKVPALGNAASYIDLYPYSQAVYDLVMGKKLSVAVGYDRDGICLTGRIDIDYADGLLLNGALALSSAENSKTVRFSMENGIVYLNLDGIKLSLNVSDAANLVKGFLGSDGSGDVLDSVMPVVGKVLDALFENDIAGQLSLSEQDNVLAIGVKGTELLKFFGVDFALGDVNLTVSGKDGAIHAEAFGASVTVGALKEQISIDKSEYSEIVPYVEALTKILTGKTLSAHVCYELDDLGGKKLSAVADVVIQPDPFAASAELNLTYGSMEKEILIVYGQDGYLYLTIDRLNIKAKVDDAVKLISSLIPASEEEQESSGFKAILDNILAIDFETIFQVSESEEKLNIVVKGTELLDVFGVKFSLGDITLRVEEDAIYAEALGVKINACAGGTLNTVSASDAEKYVDLTSLLDVLPAILEKQQICFAGSITVTVPVKVRVVIRQGVVGWKDGFALYLDATLHFGETDINLIVKADGSVAVVRAGTLSLEIVYNKIGEIGDAIVALYNRILDTINPISETQLLPEAKTIKDIVELITGLFTSAEKLGKAQEDPFGFTVENSKLPNGILSVSLLGFTLDLVNDTAKPDGILSLVFDMDSADVVVKADLSAELYDGEMPSVSVTENCLGPNEVLNLIDYVGAVFGTLCEDYFRFEITGSVASEEKLTDADGNPTQTNKYPDGKYDIRGEIELYSGADTAFHLDINNSRFWLDTNAYLRVKFSLIPKTDYDKGIYVELFMLDCDPEGKKDGTVLDVYVSLSMRKNTTKEQPLNFYAPADELMPVVSSLVALLGVDAEIVTDYLITPWLDVQTTGELASLGRAFKNLIAGIFDGVTDKVEEGSDIAGDTLNSTKGSLVKLLAGDERFELVLSSGFSVIVGKQNTQKGSRLSLVSVNSIRSGKETIDASASLVYEQREGGLVQPSYKELFKLEGVANLLKMLAHSTTHEVRADEVISGEQQEHTYHVNEYFYIDGNIDLDVNAIGLFNISVKIKLVALSITVDEEGALSVNVRLEYDAVKALGLFTVINGDTAVDVTAKGDMLYIKRVQTSDESGKKFPVPETIYRVMPLSNFAGDILNQVGFLFNLGSIITDNLAGIGGSDGGEGSGEKQEEDIGATFWNLFKGFTVDFGERNGAGEKLAGDVYTVTVNGGALVSGLQDIVVVLGTDKAGTLRTLGLTAELSTSGIALKASANFVYHNPCGVMDEGVTDVTSDIASLAEEAMDKALQEAQASNWEGLTYIEGQTTTVSYSVLGEIVATQQIFFNTKTGESYAQLKAPSVSIKGYDVSWDIPDTITANMVIYGTCTPKVYHITLHDRNGVMGDVIWDYTYGDRIQDSLAGVEKSGYRIVDSGAVTEEAIMNGDRQFTVSWAHYDYIVTYIYNDEVYAKQYYTEGEGIVLAAAPEKVGYTGVWKLEGEKVEEGYAVTANLSLTLAWEESVDPIVSLRLYSDVRFTLNGRESVADPIANGYYVEVEIDTDTDDSLPALSVEGYQQMGWWYHNGKAWAQKTSAKGLNKARLWALWIQNIKVSITDFYTSNMAGGSQYNIGGMTTGGNVFGKTGSEIYESLGMQESTEALFLIRGAKATDSIDECGGKKSVTISYDSNGIGSFMRTGMNSWAYRDTLGAGKASYGGVEITKTFTYNGLTITTKNGAIVSYDTVAVRFLDQNGNEFVTVEVRLDCPFDEYDSATYLDEIMPTRRDVVGYTWNTPAHTAITVGMTYHAYVINRYNVTLTSEDGFEADGGTYYEKTFVLTYGSTVRVMFGGNVVNEFTVGTQDAEWTLPSLREITGVDGAYWLPVVYSENGFEMIASAAVDTLTMKSDVIFTYGGESKSELSATYRDSYTLPTADEMTAVGYTFLGWFENTAAGWVQRTTLRSRSGAQITVEALWISDLTATVTSATRGNRSGFIIYKYDYNISAAVTGGQLVGAFAKEAAVCVTYKYYVNQDGKYEAGSANRYNEYSEYRSADSSATFNTQQCAYANAVAVITYSYQGKEVITVTAHGSKSF